MHHPDDSESPAEEMLRELGIAPALGDRLDDDPLLREAREQVADVGRERALDEP